MDVYDYAMQMERDGEAYYRSAARQTGHEGIRGILTMLADAEVKHYRLFEEMKRGEAAAPEDSGLLAGVKNLFQQMAESKDVSMIRLAEVDLYRKAQEIEKSSYEFYEANAGKAASDGERNVLLKIAGEEHTHYMILEQIVGFVSRPEQWLENAEWYHLEPY
jgi:rubrerythrin